MGIGDGNMIMKNVTKMSRTKKKRRLLIGNTGIMMDGT